MTQYMVPTGTPTVVGWTGSAANVADTPGTPHDATYIESPLSPTSASYWDCALSALTDPQTDDGLVLRFRPVSNATGGDLQQITVRIYRTGDGATVLSQTSQVTYPVGEVAVQLTPEQAALIASYVSGALRVRISASNATGNFTSSVTTTTAGWATVGIIASQGEIPTGVGVAIGSYTTQTDIKTTWPDGSVKIAFATAKVTTPGTYAITPQSLPGGSFTPTWPTASVAFVIGGVTYTATLPAFTASNQWLNGAQCREARVIVAPQTGGGATHPTLQVIFDVRSFNDGTHRVDVCVQNVKDSAEMDKFTHDVTMTINGSVVWTRSAFTTYGFTRWRKTFWVGTADAAPVPDFESWYRSKLVPRVRTSVTNTTYSANYDVLQFGDMPPYMMAPGGAQTIAPMSWWEARYMIHKTVNQRSAVLGNGNCTGSWSMHITEPDGVTPIKVTTYPGYWMDGRASAWPNSPRAPRRADGALRGQRTSGGSYSDVDAPPDHQHLPSASFFPYLLTGDRYYLDQTKFWAAWAIIAMYPADPIIPEPVFLPAFNRSRGYDKGYLTSAGLGREMGWPLRAVAQATVACPDTDTDRAYFQTITQNNLDFLGNYVTNIALPGGITEALGWEGSAANNQTTPVTGKANSIWRLSYTAYVVDYALRQGLWTAGTVAEFRNRVVRTQIGYLTNGANGFPPEYGCPYYPAVARVTNNGTVLEFFSSWAQAYTDNRTYPFSPAPAAPGCDTFGTANIIGYYDTEAYVLLQIGMREGIANATTAYTWLTQTYASGAVLTDVDSRSGFAVDFSRG